jgi:mono/diheme cytochrome c family protein
MVFPLPSDDGPNDKINNGGNAGNGRASVGQTLYSYRCAGCHPSATSIAGFASRINMNLGSVSRAMTGMSLTAQDVADLKAYLASLSSGGERGAAGGQTLYSQRCAGCHPSAAAISGFASMITTNMGTISPAMNGLTLTTQEVADLQAYLASLSSGGSNNSGGTGGTGAPAGQTLYGQSCIGCHPSAAAIAGFANLITTDMGTVSPAMTGLTLTAQQIADLQAYLASLPSGGTGGGTSSGNATAGQTLYTQSCVACHPSAATIAGFANLITTDMGTVSPAMTGLTLTAQQIADLQAYLATQ